jgi:DNA repair photolyase
MHFKEVKGILSPKNGMNLCRGCVHGCIYCDARSHCYHIEHDFEDVEIKSNAPELLENALKRKRQKCMIGTGAMSDPYIPLPESLQNTRTCLELIAKYGCGLAIQTKSKLILRDLDLLRQINTSAKCVVAITLTTFDEELCKILEPKVCTTKERVEVLNILKGEGIPTIVWLCPVLPFINDTEENIRGILDYCIKAGVYGIICFEMGMTLREGDREYYYRKLDEHFPGMKEKYIQTYGSSYQLLSPNNTMLMKIFHETCAAHNIDCDNDALFAYMREFPAEAAKKRTNGQMDLF